MREFIAVLVMCFVAISSTPSFAQVGVQVDNEKLGTISNIRYNTSGLAGVNKALNFNGSLLTFNLLQSGTGTSGAVSLGTGNQDVDRGYSLTYKEIGTTAETGFVNNGIPGELITITATIVGSGGRWTLTSNSSTTWNSIEFDARDDTVSLLWLSDSVGWIIFGPTDTTVRRSSF